MVKCVEDKREVDEIDLNSRECGYMTRKQRVRRTKFWKSEFITSSTYENYRAYLTASGKIHLDPISPAHESASVMGGEDKEKILERYIVDSRPYDPLYRTKWRDYPGTRWESDIENTTCICINTAFWRALQAYTGVAGNAYMEDDSLASSVAGGVFIHNIFIECDKAASYCETDSPNSILSTMFGVSREISIWFAAVSLFGPFVEVDGVTYMVLGSDSHSRPSTVTVGSNRYPGSDTILIRASPFCAGLCIRKFLADEVSPVSGILGKYRSVMDLVRSKKSSS